MERIYLSRRNLLTLLNKLDRQAKGEDTQCTILKFDNVHPKYPQTMESIAIMAIEDKDYYTTRDPGEVHPKDDPNINKE